MNKFLIIGKSNTGKSCLMDELIENNGLRPVGFRMHGIVFENEFKGYYMNSIKPVEGYHNNVPIQTVLRSKHRINLTEVYDTFGVLCLNDVLKMKKKEYDCIILDELGRGEAESPEFMEKIREILELDVNVFILMKTVSTPFTSEIRKRTDLHIYDMDNMSKEEVYLNIQSKIGK
ncbi:MAG: hypothetical protein IJP13_00445 [Lachnospiraceae bacterium]|nr:hypothetical protein [Lachnospiraceae bacterium]